jgi:hypothetical protein
VLDAARQQLAYLEVVGGAWHSIYMIAGLTFRMVYCVWWM